MFTMAQGGTQSPYSQYGLGRISDRSVGASRAMNGVGVAMREHNEVNTLNPASYSAIDSLTFILDAGMSIQTTNFKEGNKSANANTANFEYLVAIFRVMKHMGVSFGFLPYTNVGYQYSFVSEDFIHGFHSYPSTSESLKYTTSNKGNGGLRDIYLGVGYEPIKGLSVGMNASFIWGDINNITTTTYNDVAVNSLASMYMASISSYKLDFGAQYTRNIDANNTATAGLTFSPGHKLGTDAVCAIVSSDSVVSVAHDAYSLPTQWQAGISFKHKNIWKVGLDYSYMGWGSIPQVNYVDQTTGASIASTDRYKDRHAFNLGGEYCVNRMSRRFIDRIRYRMGVGYASSYFYAGQHEGPREVSVSAGFGIPIVNNYNNRSILNIGVSWKNYSAPSLITENTVMLNIGLTFNERWFAKWKFD